MGHGVADLAGVWTLDEAEALEINMT